MGQEIDTSFFDQHDFNIFAMRLREETAHLSQWFRDGRLAAREPVCGFEVEAWLIDEQCRPAPVNKPFLERMDSPWVVSELAKFNVELNTPPHDLSGAALATMERDLNATLRACQEVAGTLGAELLLIGILPTVNERDLCLANMSEMQRYRALNEQVLRMRGGEPIVVDIEGRERLHLVHDNVMLESAATSMQIHLQVAQHEAARTYNAAQILAAPVVGACANSPYFCGRDLWDETRIPLFEQSVAVNPHPERPGPTNRVYFGERYVERSLMECFQENLRRFPVLIPSSIKEPPSRLSHLRFHNGTIWRWNRPLIGFEPDGSVHLRIEHRVVPAGPSVIDSIANAAFFYGLVRFLATSEPPPEHLIGFEQVRTGFYEAARRGLDARIPWLGEREVALERLVLDELLPQAQGGLVGLGLDAADIERYLRVIERRVRLRQTGARWQRAFVERHGADLARMAAVYAGAQRSGLPVHEWEI